MSDPRDQSGVSSMLKFILALLFLLAICMAAGVYRKWRGGTFLPPPEAFEGDEPPPKTMEEIHLRRKRERERS